LEKCGIIERREGICQGIPSDFLPLRSSRQYIRPCIFQAAADPPPPSPHAGETGKTADFIDRFPYGRPSSESFSRVGTPSGLQPLRA